MSPHRPAVLAALLALLSAAEAPPAGATLDLPVLTHADFPSPLPAYRGDAVLLRLETTASARARAGMRAPLRTSARLGIPALDRVAGALGGIRYQPEFPVEAAPPPGADAIDFTTFWIAHFDVAPNLEQALSALREVPEVESASPIAVVPMDVVPNDSLWGAAWHLRQDSRHDLHAPEAWDLTVGDSSVVVGILDTGVLSAHPDLGGTIAGSPGNLWVNREEEAGQAGVDDDGNGYVDDVRGWDFVVSPEPAALPDDDAADADNDPNDFAGHGTAVAGLVAALTDNAIGVAGTAWRARILPLRVGWAVASGAVTDLSYAAQAVRYATRMGATVLNLSFATLMQPDLAAAVSEALRLGVVVVAAGGNNNSPAALSERTNVISVGAVDAEDRVPRFSNQRSYIDLVAPGVALPTTSLTRIAGRDSAGRRLPDYATGASGTSFSAPLVAGGVALLQARRRALGLPPLGAREVLLHLADTADPIDAQNPDLPPGLNGSGRLNLLRLLTEPPRGSIWPGIGRVSGALAAVSTFGGGKAVAFATTLGGDAVSLMDADTRSVRWRAPLSSAARGGVAVADLGGDVGLGVFVATMNGEIQGFHGSGRALFGWPVVATAPRVTPTRPVEPALGDLDGDGRIEVVWGGDDSRVWAWHADGTPVSPFPIQVEDAPGSVAVALSDLDGIPGVEIVASQTSGAVTVFRGDGGRLAGWEGIRVAGAGPPIVTAFPGDARPIVVVAGFDTGAAPGPRIVFLDADGGTRHVVTPAGTDPTAVHAAAGDLDGDGRDEIVVSGTEELHVLDESHVLATVRLPIGPCSVVGADPVVGFLAPARQRILQPAGGLLLGLDENGRTLPGFPKSALLGCPTVLALDADDRIDVLTGSTCDDVIFVLAGDAGSASAPASAWPTARGNFARTGSRLYAPAAAYDPFPPDPVADLGAASAGADSIVLQWTVPGDFGPDGGIARFELRYSLEAITEANFALTPVVPGLERPGTPGTAFRAVVRGLWPDAVYYFAVRAVDTGGNASTLATLATPTSGTRTGGWTANGTLLGSGADPEDHPVLDADGIGGSYVAWVEQRAGLRYVRAQRLDSEGRVAPAWPDSGVLLGCGEDVVVAADGAGGAYFAWCRGANVVVQRLGRLAAPAHGWPAGGRTDAGDPVVDPGAPGPPPSRCPSFPVLAVDDGGATIAWKTCGGTLDITRMTPGGAIAAGWDGITISTGANPTPPALCGDGRGGAFIAWGSVGSVLHVRPDGSTGELFAIVDGGTRGGLELGADSGGGCFLRWQEGRTDERPRVLRLTPTLQVAPGWPPAGVELASNATYATRTRSSTAGTHRFGTLLLDGLGGVYAAWIDRRSDNGDVYLQHLSNAGALVRGWPAGGLGVGVAEEIQHRAVIATDGRGGVFAAWEDTRRTPNIDILAAHLHADGNTYDPPGGIPVCTFAGAQTTPCIAADGAGGALIGWTDARGANTDVRVGQLTADGVVDVRAALASADFAQGRVRLVWYAAGRFGGPVAVERRAEREEFVEIARVDEEPNGRIVFEDTDVAGGARYAYRLGFLRSGTTEYTDEAWIDVPAAVLALEGARPNPAGPDLAVTFTLPDASPARLEVLDVAGRRVFVRDVGALGFGAHSMNAGAGRNLAPGLYVIRLVRGAEAIARRAVVVR